MHVAVNALLQCGVVWMLWEIYRRLYRIEGLRERKMQISKHLCRARPITEFIRIDRKSVNLINIKLKGAKNKYCKQQEVPEVSALFLLCADDDGRDTSYLSVFVYLLSDDPVYREEEYAQCSVIGIAMTR